MESEATIWMRKTDKIIREKIWYVLGGIAILATIITLTVVFWPNGEKESAILMLSTYNDKNLPMVISLKGPYDDQLEFVYEENTAVKYSCAAILNDEMYVFSGPTLRKSQEVDTYKQISKVEDCKLKRVGELPFERNTFVEGGYCGTFLFPEDEYRVMLCFYDGEGKKCMSYEGTNFDTQFPESTHRHSFVKALTSYRGKPFITGNDGSDGRSTEYLDLGSGKWTVGTPYPFGVGDNNVQPRIRNYATTYTEKSVYIIGGRHHEYDYEPNHRQMTDIIAQYNNDIWTEVGKLEKPRENHAAITVDGMTMILGGAYSSDQGSTFTEQWNMTLFENQWDATLSADQLETLKIDPEELNPTLESQYREGIALFPVKQTTDSGYCAKPSGGWF